VTELVAKLGDLRTIGLAGYRLSAKIPSEREIQRSLDRVLDSTKLCALATVDPRGRPHDCHVYFAYSPTLEIYFWSSPKSNHCRHLRTNPSMAVSVYDSRQELGGPSQGLAMDGLCRETRGVSRGRAERLYARRFPAYRVWRRQVQPGDAALGMRFFRFVPRRFKLSDDTRLGLGVIIAGSLNVNRKGTK
jgi:uncharacterized protein YhbP (UPF0306 family)